MTQTFVLHALRTNKHPLCQSMPSTPLLAHHCGNHCGQRSPYLARGLPSLGFVALLSVISCVVSGALASGYMVLITITFPLC